MSETQAGRTASGEDNSDASGASWAADLAARLERESPEGVTIGGPPPTSGAIGRFVEDMRRLVFPGVFCEGAGPARPADVERTERDLTQLLETSFRATKVDPAMLGGIDALVRAFLDGLPAVRDVLAADAQAAYDGDPAAQSPLEVVLCYPGLDAVFAYRMAHALLKLGAPLLPRMITEQAHTRTGVDIHPGAEIGPAFFIDHASGVVIGETTQIGADVTVYQGVTLGAKSFPKDAKGRVIRHIKRHPTIGDRVTIYAGAIILGGDTTIGDDCIVSANVYCTKSAPAGHIVRQKHGELQFLARPDIRDRHS
jgi:serine O-acetyltransferase